MKTFTTCLLLTFAAGTASAQNLAWAKGMGGAGTDAGKSIATDAAGNVYTTGHFEGTVDFDPGIGTYNLSSAGKKDIFISKLDAGGNFQWAIAFGDTAIDRGSFITTDAAGNIYVSGHFSGAVDFDPGPAVNGHTVIVKNAIFILKISSTGNLVWARSISAICHGWGVALAVDAVGNVYATGDFWGAADFDPGAGYYGLGASGGSFTLKLDAAGNFVWARAIGSSQALPWIVDEGVHSMAIAVDAAQNVYTAGRFISDVDLDPSAASYTFTSDSWTYDSYVSKLNASGNFVWAKTFQGPSNDLCRGITLDGSANIYICGSFGATVDFDPNAGVYNVASAISFDAFVTKLDSAGSLIWAKALGGTGFEAAYSIARDFFGNLYTIGWFDGTTDLDPGPGTYTLSSAGNYDVFVSKLDPTGNFMLAKRMGGAGSDEGTSIAIDGTGNILCTGSFSGTADFDPTPLNFNLVCGGVTDIFVAKLDTCSLSIAGHPANQTSLINGTVQFTVASSNSGSTYQWQRNTGNGFINLAMSPGYSSGVNSPTLTLSNMPLAHNNYSFRCVVSQSTCLDVSNPAVLKVLNNTAIAETGYTHLFTVYPIPSKDLVTIATTNRMPEPYTISDQTGKPVLSGTLNGPETTVDLRSLAAGLYFISVGSENKKPRKIVKQ